MILPLSHKNNVNRVFKNDQRRKKLIYHYAGSKITIINGKHTNRLGVVRDVAPTGESIEVTCLERTLIDATVRPFYAGGVANVLAAFMAARGRISVKKLGALLEMLDYTYPYHQAVGFYLKRQGYADRDQRLLRKFGLALDFYLSHGLKSPLLTRLRSFTFVEVKAEIIAAFPFPALTLTAVKM